MVLYFPKNYKPMLSHEEMEQAIKRIKGRFQEELSQALLLRRITAPLFVLSGTGINDNLSGIEQPVSFNIKSIGGKRAEIVHSLAKWKRTKLGAYGIEAGAGIYTDMNAIRADEELDNTHSLYVDQWDWERTITETDRTIPFLKRKVRKIYQALKATEFFVRDMYPQIEPILPEKIHFIHAEELQAKYPDLLPKEREYEIAKAHGAVFIIGIGGALQDGTSHDERAPDYDDWSTPTEEGYKGLNGDIILWNPILQDAFEVSSMGIRVDKTALRKQLALTNAEDRLELSFHKSLIEDKIPLSIGGGIGQSRLCMFFLRCAHIGEVQASIWSDEMIEECVAHNIILK